MTDKPIIFSAPMVRALLDGRKTQTRRVLKEQRHVATPVCVGGCWQWYGYSGAALGDVCVPYAPGDRLYVREAMHWTDNLRFVADDTPVDFDRMPEGFTAGRAHVSGMFMPRWASRITLTVTEVRVQRLQEISAEDVQAEGACELAFIPPTEADTEEARGIFRDLWNSLHGPDAWDANPWVVAVSFTVERRNIDA